MTDPALELVLPEAGDLAELPYPLLLPGKLPELWKGDEVAVQAVLAYFNGKTVVQVQRDGYMESVPIPKTSTEVINKAIAAAEILPENLPDAWSEGQATALSIATALSQRFGQALPWKTVKDVITASINARFTEIDGTSGDWPCDYPAAQSIKLKVASALSGRPDAGGISPGIPSKCLVAHAELEPSEIQDLAEIIPSLLELKAKFNTPLKFRVQIELGDGKERPSEETTKEINKLLKELKDGFEFE